MLLSSILDLYRLKRQQWLEKKELEEIQRKKLVTIVKHAYQNVTYYRRLFDSAGIKPEDIRSVDDLTKVPITRKQDIQRLSVGDVIARKIDVNQCRKILTSGSSGTPLPVYLTKKDSGFYDMVWTRTFFENGENLWDKIVDIRFRFPPKSWLEHYGIWRKTRVSALDDPRKQFEKIRWVRPDVIRADPYSLVTLARVVRQVGIDGINPRLVFTMGSLLDQHTRALIESALHTRVFDCYGTVELGCMAWECSARAGYHINIDTFVVEFIKDGEVVGKGEKGKIVCTGLHSFAMPFIRYDIGDVGIASEEGCSCGRGLPLLKNLEGRADDFFITPDGTLISPWVIIDEIKFISGISEYRITQDSETKITAQVVLHESTSLETVRQIKRTMTVIMGDDLDIRVEVVDEMPPDHSGKIRCIISNVKKGF